MAVQPVIALFDVDGTLTAARRSAAPETLAFLKALRTQIPLAVVGGSDFPKQKEQLGEDVLDLFDYSFSENGLVAYKGRELIGRMSIRDHLTSEQRVRFANWTLDYIARLDIPVKTGTFIVLRTGMYNVSPIGRNCTYEERLEFSEFDKQRRIRQKMCEDYQAAFAGWGLKFSIGGQISIDAFPESWTKVYCLQFLEGKYTDIHFFGDMTMEGGNDYEIFVDPRTIGHTVKDPPDTIRQCSEIFNVPIGSSA
jgi:phosphomannomutase